jgi:iron complex outermembrane receptor protein
LNQHDCRNAVITAITRVGIWVVCALSGLGLLQSAHAETVSETSATAGTSLEEVLVTATRRTENLEDVPISITALSAREIQNSRILTLTDLTTLAPSLISVEGTGAENYLSIRGAITIDDSTGTDQAVSLFIDDIVRTGVADYTPDLFDIDHVEVLNGPQGTLFGRNSTGGAVAIYTKNPTFTPETDLEATYGRFNLGELRGIFNVPIVDGKLAARLAVSTHYLDAWVDDPILGRKLGSENRQSLRGKLLFVPTDDLTALLTLDYARGRGSRTDWILTNFQPALDSPLYSGRDKTAQGIPGSTAQENWGVTGKIVWNTSMGSLTSISGFRHVFAADASYTAADPRTLIYLQSISHDSQFTQELRFASRSDQRLTWVGGLYYLHSEKSRPIDILFDIVPGSFLASVGIGPGVIPSIDRQNTNTSSYAGFGEATYAIFRPLKLTLGGRYTKENKDGFSFLNPSGGVVGPPASANYDGSWSAFTPKATLTYQPIQALMTYVLADKGFQGGGFNTQGSTPQALSTPFLPELVWNYEVGAKFEGLQRHLQVNVAGFVDRYSQLQITQLTGATFTNLTTNAGSAEVKGVEASLAVVPVRSLTLGVNYSFLHTEFTSYVIDNGPGVPETNNTGNKVPFAPQHRVTFTAEYHVDVPALRGAIEVGGDYTYRSAIEIDAANSAPQWLRDQTVWNGMINLHARWAAANDRWEVAFWGKNLKNIQFTPQANDQTGFFETPAEAANPDNHIYTYHPNPPRTYGVTLRAKF